MATSGTISSTLTASEIITTALELTGVQPIGDATSADIAELALKHLNWMLKTWQADGLNQFRVEEVSITWPAGTATATLDTNYLDFQNARSRISGIDLPLRRISIEEYAELPNKATTSARPLQYRVRKTTATLELALWPVPSANVTILGDAVRVIEDVADLAQTVDVPQEWLETVYVALAARLCLPLGILTTNASLVAALQQQAASLYGRLRAFDGEGDTSMFLSPAVG